MSAELSEDSELGKKEYWDKFYEVEVGNFNEFGDEGEVWFGKQWEKKICNWLSKKAVSKSAKICDLGCGNGSLLKSLANSGFTELFGVDYSEKAVKLAEGILEGKGTVSVMDILNPDNSLDDFEILIDKGTWDAISLRSDSNDALKAYKSNILRLVTKDAHFILVSCNFTEAELEVHFGSEWSKVELLPAASSFTFGGSTGNTVTGIVFSRK